MPINIEPTWRRDAAPRGVRCLVTARSITNTYLVFIATLSLDYDDERWFYNGHRIHHVIAWMPAPSPAEPLADG